MGALGNQFDALMAVGEDVGEPLSAGLTRHERIGGRAWEPRYTMTIEPDWADGQRTTALYKLDVTPDGSWYHAYVDPNPGMFSTALPWEN